MNSAWIAMKSNEEIRTVNCTVSPDGVTSTIANAHQKHHGPEWRAAATRPFRTCHGEQAVRISTVAISQKRTLRRVFRKIVLVDLERFK
jgi:hypothetical protein